MEHKGFTEQTPYPQPLSGYREFHLVEGNEEEIDYLPGTSVRIWYTHRGTCFPEHWHTAIGIIQGCNRHYTIEAAGNTYEVGESDILIIPGGIVHTLHPAEDCNGFVYFLGTAYLDKIRSAAGLAMMLSKPLMITKSSSPTLHLQTEEILERMREDYFGTNELRELLIDAELLLLLERLAHTDDEDGDRLHARADKRSEYTELFALVTTYINESYAEQLTLESVSRRFGVSRYYFSRLFKDYSQYTFAEYLNICRVKAAERLLCDPELSVTDIAFRCGFGSVSSFSRVFRSLRFCSPSEYRRMRISGHRDGA